MVVSKILSLIVHELSEVYKSRPKWTEKLAEPPCWIKEQADKEVAEVKYLQEQKKTVGNRYKLRSKIGCYFYTRGLNIGFSLSKQTSVEVHERKNWR